MAVLEKYGPEHFRAIGSKGGRPRSPRYSAREKAGQAVAGSGEAHQASKGEKLIADC
jgi:hypothetical protein